MELKQLIQQLVIIDTEIQHDIIIPKKKQKKPLSSENVPPQQIARSEFSNLLPFVFHFITERQERAFFTVVTNVFGILTNNSTNSLSFEKHCIDIYSSPPIREHHDSYLK